VQPGLEFSILKHSSPDLSTPNHVLLQHFWLGLSKESALQLDVAAGGSFNHKTIAEGEALLDCILENTPPLEPLRVEPESSHEEVSLTKAKLILPIQRPSPELKTPKEGFQPSEFPFFEDEFHEDFRNTLKYSYQKRSAVLITPLDPLDKEFLRESIRELTSILSSKCVEETERSSEEIQIHTPSLTIQCQIYRTTVDVLYNPTIEANLMSTSVAQTYLGAKPLASTNKSLRVAPCSNLEGCGILHHITVHHNNVETVLDFHVFDIHDFNIMIGHPLENFFIEPPTSGDLDIKFGRDTFFIPITHAKNSVAESLPYSKLPKEVMSVSPFESLESALEKDARLFIEEVDDLGETIDHPKEEAPA